MCWQENLQLQTASSGRRTGRGYLHTLQTAHNHVRIIKTIVLPHVIFPQFSKKKCVTIFASVAPYGLICICRGIFVLSADLETSLICLTEENKQKTSDKINPPERIDCNHFDCTCDFTFTIYIDICCQNV